MVVEEATCLFFFVLPSSIRRDNNEAKFKEATDLAKLIKYENSQKEKLFVLFRSQLSKQHLWIFDETAKDTNTLTNKSLDGGGEGSIIESRGRQKVTNFFDNLSGSTLRLIQTHGSAADSCSEENYIFFQFIIM